MSGRRITRGRSAGSSGVVRGSSSVRRWIPYARHHAASPTSTTTDHETSAHRQPMTAANGAMPMVVMTAPPFIAAVVAPMTPPTPEAKSRATTTGTATLPIVMAAPMTTVPTRAVANPPVERSTVPTRMPSRVAVPASAVPARLTSVAASGVTSA